MKQLLRVFALGILTTVVIIGVFYFFFEEQQIQIQIETVEMTEGEMIDSLEDIGYFVFETNPLKVEDEQPLVDTPPIEDDGVDEDKVESAADKLDDESGEGTADENSNQTIILMIEPGMTISDVANDLIQADLIANRNELATYLLENNYGTNIQIGQFELNSSMSIEEIAEIIAKQVNE